MDFINDFNAHDLLTLIDSIKLKISNMEYKDILDEVTKLHKNGDKMKKKCISLNEKLKQSENRELQYLQEIKEFLVSDALLNQNNAYLKNEVAILKDKLEKIKNYLSVTNIGFQLKDLYSELNNAFIVLNDKKEYASHFYKRMDTELEEPYWRIKLVTEKMFNMVESLKFNEKDKKIEKYYNASILKKINYLIEKDMLYRTPTYRQLTRIEPLTTTIIDETTRTSNYNSSLSNQNLNRPSTNYSSSNEINDTSNSNSSNSNSSNTNQNINQNINGNISENISSNIESSSSDNNISNTNGADRSNNTNINNRIINRMSTEI